MQQQQENRMGTMPIKKLIVSISLPMMISMLVQALYNVVDSIFVSKINEAALTAVTLAFPLQNMMIAVASGTGVGINALLSRALGEKRFEQSNAAANKGILLAFLSAVVFCIIGVVASEPFIASQANDALIAEYGTLYLSCVCIFSFGLFFQITFERLLQSTGNSIYSMITQLTGAIINIVLDPILIFGYFGAPEMGVLGAAVATVIGQSVAAVIGLVLNLLKNKELHISLKSILASDAATIRKIYIVGVPSILMMSIGSLMTYLMNLILMGFSSTATAVFGAYFKLQSFFFMPVFGLNNGLIPVLAYNYGAAHKNRIDEALRFSVRLALSIMVLGMVVFLTLPNVLLGFFDASEEMLALGVPAMRTICLHFPIAAVCIAMSSVFQAFSQSVYSLIISVCRQLVVLIPAAWVLGQIGGVNAVWWSFLIAEFMSLALTILYFKRLYRTTIKPLEGVMHG